jgi:hypothetical protein
MTIKLERCPKWAERALQGLTFWIGHRHALYNGHPLVEGALVVEACNLIRANLSNGEILLCEVQYSRLVTSGQWPISLGVKCRADLTLVKGPIGSQPRESGDLVHSASAVIEVKRASASRAEIDNDLRRLAALKSRNPSVRALLFLVSEARRPIRFVSDEGRAIRGKQEISMTTAYYCVRRACKAASSFAGRNSAHYACIIEVFN